MARLYDFALWPHTWPWHWIFMVKDWNSLTSEMGGPIGMERRKCNTIIHDHNADICVTILGCVDVWESDRGDFRRRHVFDISSFLCNKQNIGLHVTPVFTIDASVMLASGAFFALTLLYDVITSLFETINRQMAVRNWRLSWSALCLLMMSAIRHGAMMTSS